MNIRLIKVLPLLVALGGNALACRGRDGRPALGTRTIMLTQVLPRELVAEISGVSAPAS